MVFSRKYLVDEREREGALPKTKISTFEHEWSPFISVVERNQNER